MFAGRIEPEAKAFCAKLYGDRTKACETGKKGEQTRSCRSLMLTAFSGSLMLICALMFSEGLHEAIVQQIVYWGQEKIIYRLGSSSHLSKFILSECQLPCIFCPPSLIVCLSKNGTSRVEVEVHREGCGEAGVTCAETHEGLGVVTSKGCSV